jgi:hypothetical protein
MKCFVYPGNISIDKISESAVNAGKRLRKCLVEALNEAAFL